MVAVRLTFMPSVRLVLLSRVVRTSRLAEDCYAAPTDTDYKESLIDDVTMSRSLVPIR